MPRAIIIIVDDMPESAEMASLAITEGQTLPAPNVFHDPREALAWSEHLDSAPVLVTDYQMPYMNGTELAHAMRAIHPTTQTIVVTGLPDQVEPEPAIMAVIPKGGPGFLVRLVEEVSKAVCKGSVRE